MTWVAIGVSLLSVAMTFFFRGKNTKVVLALEESKAREASLVHTLAEVVDNDGTVRGQLMLPGKTHTDDAVEQLRRAQTDLAEVTDQAKTDLSMLTVQADDLRREIARERKDDEAARQLIEVVNKGSIVQLRLPGEVVKPNRTPCGDMCKHAFFTKTGKKLHPTSDFYRGRWNCKANQGIEADASRRHFLDADNQCVMFVRDTDC